MSVWSEAIYILYMESLGVMSRLSNEAGMIQTFTFFNLPGMQLSSYHYKLLIWVKDGSN